MILYYEHTGIDTEFIKIDWSSQPDVFISFWLWDSRRLTWIRTGGYNSGKPAIGLIRRSRLREYYRRIPKSKFLIEAL